jgi:toxin ParE1/3/4
VKVRYRRRAQLDIDGIHQYLHERNPRAATDVVARIRLAAERLGAWPYIGHLGRAPGTCEWVVVGLPYVIVYELNMAAGEIAIIAVFHGSQDRDRRQE